MSIIMEVTSKLELQIKDDLKKAMIARQNDVRDVLRGVTSELKNRQIDNGQEPLTDEQVIEVLTKMEKQRKDSISQYIDGGREDLAEAEKAELEIIARYLPQKLTEDELDVIVKEEIEKLGDDANIGSVMKSVMPRVKGQADGNDVRNIAEKYL
jgi:uncharacterized protein YqeY